MHTKKIIKSVTILLSIFALGLLVLSIYRAGWFLPAKRIKTPSMMGNRLLIIAPHPDDETLAAGGIMQEAIKSGITVQVVIITAGDGYRKAILKNYGLKSPQPKDYQKLGADRHNETVSALNVLGLSKDNLFFLSYPDGGTKSLWESEWDNDNPHKGLNGCTSSPYPFSYEKNANYSGENLAKNLMQIMQRFSPTDIIYPDGNDRHNDHWATNCFIEYVTTQMKYQGRKWGYLVHLGDYPWPWQYSPAQPLHAPDSMKNVEVKWTYFPLTADEENKKYQAIKEYQSQLKVAPAFLEAFVRKNELFIANEKKVLRYNDSITVKKPVSDNFIDEWHTGPHFKSVLHRAAIAYLNIKRTDKKLIVGLKTRQEIKKGVQYKFHMRLFQESLVKKLELTINNNKLSASPNAENSMSLPPGSVLCIKDNLIVELPERILEGVDTLLLYAETIDNGRLIDKTSCQLLQVSGDERR